MAKQKRSLSPTTAAATKRAKAGRFTVPKDEVHTPTIAKEKVTIVSANIPGLRALLKAEDRKAHLNALFTKLQPDIVLLQEHKLQEQHLEQDPSVKEFSTVDLKDYEQFWSFSTAKKGYSGVATFVKKSFLEKEPIEKVSYRLSTDEGSHVFDNEGRVVVLVFKSFSILNLYVPNSGMKLQRLSERTDKWDRTFENFFKELEETTKRPVLALGDFNVAFRVRDMHNFYHNKTRDVSEAEEMEVSQEQYKGVKQLMKLAGCTIEERLSFQKVLDTSGAVDSFVHFNPEAKGRFTYWSHRSNNRPFNQGLRLDYALASRSLLEDSKEVKLLNTFHLDEDDSSDWNLSDHCPIGCFLELK